MGREILFRGKRIDNGEWVEGNLIHEPYGKVIRFYAVAGFRKKTKKTIAPETVCRRAGIIEGKEIWENDICSWVDSTYGKCTGVVRYGEWEQDGSGGEYGVTKCLGWYLEVTKVQSLMPDVYTDAEAEEIYPE